MRGLCFALIYPYLSYGKIVWGNTYTTRLEPIRRLQKKIIRIITFSKFKEQTGPLFKELLISPLDDINKEALALFMCRYFSNNLPSSFNDFFCLNKDVHQYNTRPSSNVHKIQARNDYQKHSVKIQRSFNMEQLAKIYKEIKTFNLFRKTINTHVLRKQEN